MNEKSSVLSVKDVKKCYGRGDPPFYALSGVSFEVEHGGFTGIMGPSGAGKSTLLNLIATIDRPSAGQIIVDGTDVTSMKETELADFRRRKLGFIFQDYNLLPKLTSEENIALPLVLSKEKPPLRSQKVLAVASALGISEILEQYPSTLSGGQKQRVAAARAMVTSPALLLADEPTGALDSKSSRELLETFSTLNRERQATIILVTHDCFTASYCRRVLFLKDGRLACDLRRDASTRQEFYDLLSEANARLENTDVGKVTA